MIFSFLLFILFIFPIFIFEYLRTIFDNFLIFLVLFITFLWNVLGIRLMIILGMKVIMLVSFFLLIGLLLVFGFLSGKFFLDFSSDPRRNQLFPNFFVANEFFQYLKGSPT